MGDQKTQQPSEHASKSPEKHIAEPTQTVEPAAYSTDTHTLSRLSGVGSLLPVSGESLSRPPANCKNWAKCPRRQTSATIMN
jgi:hypothetical protein